MHQAPDKSMLTCLNHQENSQYSLLFNLYFYISYTVGNKPFLPVWQKMIRRNKVDLCIVERFVYKKNDPVPYFL